MNKILMFIPKLTVFAVVLILFSVNNAAAYRPVPLKIEVVAAGAGQVAFSGWCNIAISNKTLHKNEFDGEDNSMEPIEVYGRHIDSCEILNESGTGTITLILHANGVEIYRKTSKSGDKTLLYGPIMQRYSTRPPTMQ